MFPYDFFLRRNKYIFVSKVTSLYCMHQGNIIFQIIKKKGIPLTVIARKLKISRVTLYKRLSQETLEIEFLLAIGKIIGHDFSGFLPEVRIYEKNAKDAIIEIQRSYINALEKNIELFFVTIKAMDEAPRPIIRKEIARFIKKLHPLWLKNKPK